MMTDSGDEIKIGLTEGGITLEAVGKDGGPVLIDEEALGWLRHAFGQAEYALTYKENEAK